MKRSIILSIVGAALALFPFQLPAQSSGSTVIQSQPLNGGSISPMLFGNFIELVDDDTPGMWAEMLNDRCFEGITPMFNSF